MPKILWVEDRPETISSVIEELAEEPGYSIDLVTNVEDALKKLEAESYTAVIVDLSIPVAASADTVAPANESPAIFNGLTVIERCLSVRKKSHRKEWPAVVIYSSHAEGYFRQIADARYLTLPFIGKAEMLMQPAEAADHLKDAIGSAHAAPEAVRPKAEDRATLGVAAPQGSISLDRMIIHDLRVPLGQSVPLARSVETQLAILAGVPAEHASRPFGLRENIAAFILDAETLIDEIVDGDPRKLPGRLDELIGLIESLKNLPSPVSANTSMLVDKLSAITGIGQTERHPALAELAMRAMRLQIGASIEDIQILRANLLRALDISFGTEKKPALSRELDSSQILVAVLNGANAAALNRGIEFRPRITPGLIVSHTSDAALERVFSNLIDNAVKYNGQLRNENAWINVSHQAAREGGIITEIETWGRRLSDEEIASLRGESASVNHRIRRAIGTGLGLPIVRAELEKIGGTLEIFPHRRGTRNEMLTFRVTIPARSGHAQIKP